MNIAKQFSFIRPGARVRWMDPAAEDYGSEKKMHLDSVYEVVAIGGDSSAKSRVENDDDVVLVHEIGGGEAEVLPKELLPEDERSRDEDLYDLVHTATGIFFRHVREQIRIILNRFDICAVNFPDLGFCDTPIPDGVTSIVTVESLYRDEDEIRICASGEEDSITLDLDAVGTYTQHWVLEAMRIIEQKIIRGEFSVNDNCEVDYAEN